MSKGVTWGSRDTLWIFSDTSHDSESSDDSLDDLTIAEDKALAPPLFTGTSAENGEDWYRHFEHYCSHKKMIEPKKLALFKVLMTDLAGNWLASLPDTSTDSYANIKQAFDARYKVPEMVKYKSAKDLFSRKQQQYESVKGCCHGNKILKKLAKIALTLVT